MPNDWCMASHDGKGELVVCIFDEIARDAEDFFRDVRGIRPKAVSIFINSPGGDLLTGMAIANTIRSWQSAGARVVVEVAGIAGSAAALIAAAADEVRMPAGGFLFLHNAAYVDGKPADDRLADLNNGMARRFAEKAGRGRDEILALMADERWLDAAEAVSFGFADVVLDDESAGA